MNTNRTKQVPTCHRPSCLSRLRPSWAAAVYRGQHHLDKLYIGVCSCSCPLAIVHIVEGTEWGSQCSRIFRTAVTQMFYSPCLTCVHFGPISMWLALILWWLSNSRRHILRNMLWEHLLELHGACPNRSTTWAPCWFFCFAVWTSSVVLLPGPFLGLIRLPLPCTPHFRECLWVFFDCNSNERVTRKTRCTLTELCQSSGSCACRHHSISVLMAKWLSSISAECVRAASFDHQRGDGWPEYCIVVDLHGISLQAFHGMLSNTIPHSGNAGHRLRLLIIASPFAILMFNDIRNQLNGAFE